MAVHADVQRDENGRVLALHALCALCHAPHGPERGQSSRRSRPPGRVEAPQPTALGDHFRSGVLQQPVLLPLHELIQHLRGYRRERERVRLGAPHQLRLRPHPAQSREAGSKVQLGRHLLFLLVHGRRSPLDDDVVGDSGERFAHRGGGQLYPELPWHDVEPVAALVQCRGEGCGVTAPGPGQALHAAGALGHLLADVRHH
mmetsp:Transcript_76806/g.184005  ORF Transcript_76806/g.184005 Transcript_76806/m.184005 type:complete len:201 (-) Transcript_76806:756-1358(-)